MTKIENLLLVSMEEAAELQQNISKAMRFGMHTYCEEYQHKVDNESELLLEFYQLQAMIEHMQDIGILKKIPKEDIEKIKSNKLEKVYKYMDVSKSLDLLK